MRFWRPEGDPPGEELYLVGGVSSGKRLYVVLEGPALPMPVPEYPHGIVDTADLLAVRILTPSGDDLSRGASGKRGNAETGSPRVWFERAALPPEPYAPLTVQLLRENGSMIWETRLLPVE